MNPNNQQKLFGFSYEEPKEKPGEKLSPVPPNADDGVAEAIERFVFGRES